MGAFALNAQEVGKTKKETEKTCCKAKDSKMKSCCKKAMEKVSKTKESCCKAKKEEAKK